MKHRMVRRLRRSTAAPDCHEVGTVLQRYLDGDIGPERARQIDAHLEHCLRCGLEVAAYQRIKAALASQRPEVSAESVERLREFAQRLAAGDHPVGP